MKNILYFIFLLGACHFAEAQITFQKTFDGGSIFLLSALDQTLDGALSSAVVSVQILSFLKRTKFVTLNGLLKPPDMECSTSSLIPMAQSII